MDLRQLEIFAKVAGPGFCSKFPDMSITALIGDSQAAVDWVGEGRAEIAVVGARLPHRGVDYRELSPTGRRNAGGRR